LGNNKNFYRKGKKGAEGKENSEYFTKKQELGKTLIAGCPKV
jgi:hypothetical protein